MSYELAPRATKQSMTADRGADAELRRELAARHTDAYAWALACCRQHRSDAEDVLHSAYEKVLDGRARFDRHSSFKTWLFGVIRLTAADQRRRHVLRNLLAGRWVAEAAQDDAAPAADAEAEHNQQRNALIRALAELPERQREVLLLVFYHEMTVEDAAQVMAVGIGSARQHYARGKARLRQLLAEGERR